MSVEILVEKIKELTEKEREDFLALVSAEKKEKISRQKIRKKADTMLMGEITAKRAISKLSGKDIKDIEFSYTKNGKPYLKDNENIHFSISHSKDYVSVALSDNPIGIDIERIRPVTLSFAKRVLNEDEFQAFINAADKDSEFIKFWTRKEAVIKLHGKKLLISDIRNCITDETVSSKRLENYWLSVAERKK